MGKIRIVDNAPEVSEEGEMLVRRALPFVRFLVDTHAEELRDILRMRKLRPETVVPHLIIADGMESMFWKSVSMAILSFHSLQTIW